MIGIDSHPVASIISAISGKGFTAIIRIFNVQI